LDDKTIVLNIDRTLVSFLLGRGASIGVLQPHLVKLLYQTFLKENINVIKHCVHVLYEHCLDLDTNFMCSVEIGCSASLCNANAPIQTEIGCSASLYNTPIRSLIGCSASRFAEAYDGLPFLTKHSLEYAFSAIVLEKIICNQLFVEIVSLDSQSAPVA
jgi:hypothetical protein